MQMSSKCYSIPAPNYRFTRAISTQKSNYAGSQISMRKLQKAEVGKSRTQFCRAALKVTSLMPSTSTNPALRYGKFQEADRMGSMGGFRTLRERGQSLEEVMSIEGVVDKSFLLLFLAVAAAGGVWSQVYTGAVTGAAVMAATQGAGIAGLVLAIATCFKPQWSPYTAPLYALCQGVALGGTSAFLEVIYPGVVVQALSLTFGTLFSLLAAFRTGLINVNQSFKTVVYTATGGLFVGMMGMGLLRMCGVALPSMYAGPMGLAVSVISVGLASSHLLLDFESIEQMSFRQSPKYMEWYSGFSLLVTLVW
eukprot:CAMPEP_0196578272 /NCGR_PEP_ID=MMETSP1081-20130531/7201_1 /TAXON_ID=36882 /ORGANISM="Pyramimonas amylifera, Strain CCMP720" /LENGTH=307 /DNA_ID=CAMNT_0041897433 /DNA_START=44 /DNA_END=964 /DNA_ORIENTATION=-